MNYPKYRIAKLETVQNDIIIDTRYTPQIKYVEKCEWDNLGNWAADGFGTKDYALKEIARSKEYANRYIRSTYEDM